MPKTKLVLKLLILLVGVSSILGAQERFKYSYIPKQIYANQIFPVTILETNTSKESPVFLFNTNQDQQPLFKKPLLIKNTNESFYTFYFQSSKDRFTLPELIITENNISTYLDSTKIPIASLKPKADFCAVLAAEMKIKTSQASTFDEKNNLITLSIEAFEANLEDMHLIGVADEGIENVKRKGAKVKGEYYVVLPASQKNLYFTYFNTIKEQYIALYAPIIVKDYSVSTQSALNPKSNPFDNVKKLLFVTLAVLFFLLFLWKRDFFYLVLMVLAISILLVFHTPRKKICIREGAPLYILPTATSRISTHIESQLETILLSERKEFNKIENKDQIVGWIKDEDLCKN